MDELMSQQDFRVALEDAFSGTMAKDASFSRAWAMGKLDKHHFVHWATNHYHYVGPFGDYLGLMYANTPDYARDAKDFLLQNMYEEELSDERHTDLLIRFAEACGGTRAYVQTGATPRRSPRASKAGCTTCRAPRTSWCHRRR